MPLTEAELIVRSAVPEFVMVTDCTPLVPSVTLPNARLPGRIEIAGAAAAVPVPVNETEDGEVGALLITVTLPGRLPVDVGANCTLKLADAPAVTVAGTVIPLTV